MGEGHERQDSSSKNQDCEIADNFVAKSLMCTAN